MSAGIGCGSRSPGSPGARRNSGPRKASTCRTFPRALAAARAALVLPRGPTPGPRPPLGVVGAGDNARDDHAAAAGLPLHAAAAPALAAKGLSCSNNRITCDALHCPPRAAGMPRSCRPAARARSDVAPAHAACLAALRTTVAQPRPQHRARPEKPEEIVRGFGRDHCRRRSGAGDVADVRWAIVAA
jgi:hypothetical protein